MNREELLLKIEQTEKAIRKTKSDRCKRDLTKSIHRLRRELRDYDNFQNRAKLLRNAPN